VGGWEEVNVKAKEERSGKMDEKKTISKRTMRI
jgi:hypothetical protein